MNELRWLHLSDIHFRGDEQYETQRMRDMLIEKLKEISIEKSIDMIFITGDLAYQGRAYDKGLEKFIEEILCVTGVSINKLFIVPGNHDLKRSQLRNLIIASTHTDEFKIEDDTLRTLKEGFKQYNAFYKKIKNEDCNCLYQVVNSGEINIILMNTALTAGTNEDDGKLVIQKEEFYNTLKILKDKEKCINIVLGHHPLTCFSTNSQQIIINMFNDYNVDLYLCGHMHKAGYMYDLSGQRTIPSYQCGGGMIDGYATVTFLIGDLNIEEKRGNLTYYKWMMPEEAWIKGGSEGRRALSGEIELVLDRFKEEEFTSIMDIDINEDEFRRFMMELHNILKKRRIKNSNIEPRDVFDKFSNMKCNKSVEKQYHSLCRYFPIIDEIMESSLLSQIEKESIPNIVISEYNNLLGISSNGNEIIEAIVKNIFEEYSGGFQCSNTLLKTYLKILVYWSIYECDIFNEKI